MPIASASKTLPKVRSLTSSSSSSSSSSSGVGVQLEQVGVDCATDFSLRSADGSMYWLLATPRSARRSPSLPVEPESSLDAMSGNTTSPAEACLCSSCVATEPAAAGVENSVWPSSWLSAVAAPHLKMPNSKRATLLRANPL
eukprot:CAMPEP_0115448990 /NCGR_PEP_ID=MMETSP0271-20121206/40775_1 /TAXON_ID=71861 /ORGANISM="Scrippsiella trochoidea, Strain CCMP3099" /LENGTH=141 /DNA_ID=CAMNT_0002875127 /DNA_START=128 /DNA_END=549 /DNA_ORIENTATION=+